MNDKPFKTIDEQINILKSRNLVISDVDKVKTLLLTYGYYEIINGYKEAFLESPTPNERFKDGTNFDDLFHLFFADIQIRDAVMSSIELFEGYICNVTAYVFSKNHGSNQSELVNSENFKRGKRNYNNGRFINYERDSLFIKIDKIINDNIEPFKHYRVDHHNVPAWIMVKGMTFGNIKTFIRLLKDDDKEDIIKTIYKQDILNKVSIQVLKGFLSNELNFINAYRNRAAHGGRIYNYKTKRDIPYNYNLHARYFNINRPTYHNQMIGKNNFKTLIILLSCFKYSAPNELLESNLDRVLKWFEADMDSSTCSYLKRELGL